MTCPGCNGNGLSPLSDDINLITCFDCHGKGALDNDPSQAIGKTAKQAKGSHKASRRSVYTLHKARAQAQQEKKARDRSRMKVLRVPWAVQWRTKMAEILTSKMITVAEACHEMNRKLCELLGDRSQLPWSKAPLWQRDAAINGVKFRLNNPDAPASSSHENWVQHKMGAGWKHGPIKDEEKKEHPCLVPFSELSPEQQAKDMVFAATVQAFMGQE